MIIFFFVRILNKTGRHFGRYWQLLFAILPFSGDGEGDGPRTDRRWNTGSLAGVRARGDGRDGSCCAIMGRCEGKSCGGGAQCAFSSRVRKSSPPRIARSWSIGHFENFWSGEKKGKILSLSIFSIDHFVYVFP